MSFAWLLEFKTQMASVYLKSPQTATFDANDALQFATKDEAEAYRALHGISTFEATEHGFYDGPALVKATDIEVEADGQAFVKISSKSLGQMKIYLSFDQAAYVRDRLMQILASDRSPF